MDLFDLGEAMGGVIHPWTGPQLSSEEIGISDEDCALLAQQLTLQPQLQVVVAPVGLGVLFDSGRGT